MADNHDWVKLQIGSRDTPINADGYLGFLQSAIAALKAIDKGLSAHGSETLGWVVTEAGFSSPLSATLRGKSLNRQDDETPYSETVCSSFVEGIALLNTAKICPPHFTTNALQAAIHMAESAKIHHLKAAVSTAIKYVPIENSFSGNAGWALQALELTKPYYVEYGSIEGTLKQLGIGRGHDTLVIVERLTGHETTCTLKLPELDSLVREAWKKRVAVTGSIRIDRSTRKPTKVAVDEIRILPDRSDLPQMENLHGIDITGGVDSAAYIRGVRDAD